MTLPEFCRKLATLSLTQSEVGLAILWYHDEKTPDIVMTPGELAKHIYDAGLGTPHSTKLGEAIRKTGKVVATKAGLRLKMLARADIRESLLPILGAVQPSVDQDLGYLPQGVWVGTRGYIEKVCEQLNGCYQFGLYDAASVMMRRLVETLIIEAYEKLAREAEVKDAGGNYLMLRDLVARATGADPIGLGRDAREALGRIKELGDRSAHNRRYNACRSDLDKAQSGVRVVVDELLNIVDLRRPTSRSAA